MDWRDLDAQPTMGGRNQQWSATVRASGALRLLNNKTTEDSVGRGPGRAPTVRTPRAPCRAHQTSIHLHQPLICPDLAVLHGLCSGPDDLLVCKSVDGNMRCH